MEFFITINVTQIPHLDKSKEDHLKRLENDPKISTVIDHGDKCNFLWYRQPDGTLVKHDDLMRNGALKWEDFGFGIKPGDLPPWHNALSPYIERVDGRHEYGVGQIRDRKIILDGYSTWGSAHAHCRQEVSRNESCVVAKLLLWAEGPESLIDALDLHRKILGE